MTPTRFNTRASGVSERICGFMAHLRENGMAVGVLESSQILQSMDLLNTHSSEDLRVVCKLVCAQRADTYQQFDELFDAYWFAQGRQRDSVQQKDSATSKSMRNLFDHSQSSATTGDAAQSEPDSAESNGDNGGSDHTGDGKLTGSRITNLEKTDLRTLMTPDDIEKAQQIAEQLARAIRDKRSRRRRASLRGAAIDMRRVIRSSISHAGDPVHLYRQRKPDRTVNLVALLDVSGSMTIYARVFLSFLKGLVANDSRTDAYLFHTSLVRVSDALRDRDSFRAINRLSLMAQGFGGGTRIAANIQKFNEQYAKTTVNGRTVVMILSDGYDTDPPAELSAALARLKKRGGKIIWLNPLKGWSDYQPVAKGMAAALPFLDMFCAANTLESLAALEPHLVKL